ncbi:hypothetical protein GOP47_0019104 [Adiantum capillus-veneris]|uniref:U-box domain-containing protein n=1 Tax=Adiantum capillus-veneris TaxID=13818 RepID=A0A9D4UES1_ADICA|nr:hypothetical protein GOP47_0019104 [Adiantum capillus-veneris]
MANALDILPLHLLHVSNEIKEQIRLVYSHLRRIQKPQVDPTITALRDRILVLIQEEVEKIDVAELHFIVTSLHLSTYAMCNQEVELLTTEMHTQAGTGDERTQEHAVTAMLNLSICENNKSLIMAAGALDALVEVLRAGATMTARENAAATLFSLSMVNGYKLAIGEKPGAISGLVALLREGTSRGKKDAVTALFHLCFFAGNKAKVMNAGAIPVLLHLLSDERACITDDVLSILAVLAESKDGCATIDEGKATPVLVELLRLGSAKGKENAVAVLLALCKHGGEHVVSSLSRMDMALPAVEALSELGSSARAKRKASSLLKLLHMQLVSH